MNPYLIEPYNAYTHGKKRKKHWTELMEEEALYHKMIQDSIKLNEIQSSQQQTTAQAAAAAGAGGVAPYEYYNPGTKVINFSATPLYGNAPLTVQFSNTTTNAEDDNFVWYFGDGETSTLTQPGSHTYNVTGSVITATGTGSYTVTLSSSQPSLGQSGQTTKAGYISASQPTINAFTFAPNRSRTNINDPLTFTNNISGANRIIVKWGDGANSSASYSGSYSVTATSMTHSYTSQSTYTASISASSTLYGLASVFTASYITIDQPVTAFFTSSGTLRGNVPLPVTFSNQSTGGATYLWTFGTGSFTSTVAGLTGTGVTCSYTSANEGAALYTVSLAVSGTFGSGSLFTSASMISASRA